MTVANTSFLYDLDLGTDGRLYASELDTGEVSVIDLTTGSASTIVSGLSSPKAIDFDSAGNLFVAENGTGTISEDYTDGEWGPAPARTFRPNPWRLYDLPGKVSEWVEGCWHDTYLRAPTNGVAWVNPGCEQRVLRGGSWGSNPLWARSAFREAGGYGVWNNQIGFRVARDL